jgi:ubiquinone biosynthesis protein
MFNSSSSALLQIAKSVSPQKFQEQLHIMADAMGDASFAKRVSREMVNLTQPHLVVPDVYDQYRPVVKDGIEVFLSQVKRKRLIELVANQVQLDDDTDMKERLLELAKQFPTLHKLGQVIARHPNINSEVKKWLIHLEKGLYGTPLDGILETIESELKENKFSNQVRLIPSIIAEASVGAVVQFKWHPPTGQGSFDGVFKVLKPGIRDKLDEELTIIEKTAAYFEKNRSRYPLKDFRFLDVFNEVRDMLVKEIDLAAEQLFISQAKHFYKDMPRIKIPELFHFCTNQMTAMTYLDGPKITDADLNESQRHRCAEILFKALICKPLFCRHKTGLFHGDPHAGNILAVKDPASGRIQIGLLDWALAGRLTKAHRIKTVQLIQAVFRKDLTGIRRSVKSLAIGASWDNFHKRQKFREMVLNLLNSPTFSDSSQLKKTFLLIEQLALEGFIFPADLMLFRKAIFTLEGVIYDLWPSFDMETATIQYMADMIYREVPKRIGSLFFPWSDKPENYHSLISNFELNTLMVHQTFTAMSASSRSFANSYCAWGRFFGSSPNHTDSIDHI